MSELLDVDTESKIDAQTASPDTEPTKWMTLSDEQRNSAPENIKALLDAKKWNSIEDIAKSYSELEKFTGVGKHLVIPDSDDAEAWDNVWNTLGRPEQPDGYQLETNDAFEEELVSKWKQFAHSEGYTQRQMEGAVQFQLDIISAMNEADNAVKEETKKTLIQKYGGEAQYKNKVIEMRQLADKLGIYKTLESKGIASDPAVIDMLDKIQTGTNESVITRDTPSETPAKNPVEELEDIKKSDAFRQKFHPQHKSTMTRFMELNMIIANSGSAPKRPQGG